MPSPTVANIEMWIALAVGTAAIAEDVWRRQISNWISVVALLSGLSFQVWNSGLRGLGTAALGCVVGFVVFLLFYLLGGMGGGDVKLMAGFGALLGPSRALEAALYTAMAGALLAVIVIGVSAAGRLFRKSGQTAAAPRSIPYAPAIAAGVWLALVPH